MGTMKTSALPSIQGKGAGHPPFPGYRLTSAADGTFCWRIRLERSWPRSLSLGPPPPAANSPELVSQIPFGAPLPSLSDPPRQSSLFLLRCYGARRLQGTYQAAPVAGTVSVQPPSQLVRLGRVGGLSPREEETQNGRRGAGEAAIKRKSELDRPALPCAVFDRLPSLRCYRRSDFFCATNANRFSSAPPPSPESPTSPFASPRPHLSRSISQAPCRGREYFSPKHPSAFPCQALVTRGEKCRSEGAPGASKEPATGGRSLNGPVPAPRLAGFQYCVWFP